MKTKITIFSFPELETSEAKVIIEELQIVLKKYNIEPFIITGDFHTIAKDELIRVIEGLKS